ncbi:hypothetical protein IB286_09215 [Spongiibacter sp. KMU-158]|uniref:Uncharacterized protein n=2 Tax=Spongiibacter pelagi TaxID=2760804 RepID=A0A927C0V5_9GAMM|nr:hypothetical protein [Spongiibacter pelagi]
MSNSATAIAASSNGRPRLNPAITAKLQALDPLLDSEWHKEVSALFKDLSNVERKYAFSRHLAPKGIRLDTQAKKLVFPGRPSPTEIRGEIKSPQLHSIINKLEKTYQELRITRDVFDFADLLESSLSIVESFDPNSDLAQKREKNRVRQAHLDQLVSIVRESEFTPPQTRRGLTTGIIKDYLIEVFIRHQMLGYRFRLTPIDELRQWNHPLIAEQIANEAEVRQCDVITTTRYIYLVGPVRDFKQNPYSARRFLSEDSAMNESTAFFQAMAIPLKSLNINKIANHLLWTVTRILTLERQISQDIVKLVEQFKDARLNALQPILKLEIAADGSELEEQIRKRLTAYEEVLVQQILSKLPLAVRQLAKSNDDHDYLFFHLHSLISQLATDVRDYASQYAVAYSKSAEELELRLLSYLCLIEKRQDQIFSVQSQKGPASSANSNTPAQEFRSAINTFEPQAHKLQQKLQALYSAQQKPRGKFGTWWDEVRNTHHKRLAAMASLEREAGQNQKQCLVSMIKTCKRLADLTVFLELEDVIEVDDNQRHYALPAGIEGISALPYLVQLWEDHTLLNFTHLRKSLGENV